MSLKATRILTIITFIGLSIIMGDYFFEAHNYTYLGLSFWFILIAGFFNLLFFVVLLISLIRKKEQRLQTRKRILMLLINVPVAILYLFVMHIWDNTLRLTIENNSDNNITQIKIMGSVSRSIAEIKAHDSKTIWIHNPDTCSLRVNYKEKGVLKNNLINKAINGGGDAHWGFGDAPIYNVEDDGCYVEPMANQGSLSFLPQRH